MTYKDKIFHYDDLKNVDFSEDFSPKDANWDFLVFHILGVDHVGHSV